MFRNEQKLRACTNNLNLNSKLQWININKFLMLLNQQNKWNLPLQFLKPPASINAYLHLN